MRLKTALAALCLHMMVLIVAATSFAVLGPLGSDTGWTFQYYCYSSSWGWGHAYRSDYSFPIVVTYIAANLLGLVAYWMARKSVQLLWVAAGLLLSGSGLFSFALEARQISADSTNWQSLIISCPAVALLLAGWVSFLLIRALIRNSKTSVSAPSASGPPVVVA